MRFESVKIEWRLRAKMYLYKFALMTTTMMFLIIFSDVKEGFANNKYLFGTIEFRADMSKIKTWVDILNRQGVSDFFESGAQWRGSYAQFRAKFISLQATPRAQLELVNSYWNQYPYREDSAVYNMPDYWAIPEQFARNSGDCEDYAIAKYYTLRDLGYSEDNMRVVVVYEPIRGFAHAILAVYFENDIMILDNLSEIVYSHRQMKTYEPRYSLNHKWRWVHMKPKNKVQ